MANTTKTKCNSKFGIFFVLASVTIYLLVIKDFKLEGIFIGQISEMSSPLYWQFFLQEKVTDLFLELAGLKKWYFIHPL